MVALLLNVLSQSCVFAMCLNWARLAWKGPSYRCLVDWSCAIAKKPHSALFQTRAYLTIMDFKILIWISNHLKIFTTHRLNHGSINSLIGRPWPQVQVPLLQRLWVLAKVRQPMSAMLRTSRTWFLDCKMCASQEGQLCYFAFFLVDCQISGP